MCADEFTKIDFNPRPEHLRNAPAYQDDFRNTCRSFPGISEMPIFQTFAPANTLAVAHDQVSFCYTYVGDLKMAAPSEEKLICDKFNLEALTVNQVKSFKVLADGKDVFIGTKTGRGITLIKKCL
jgi:hypothetical protein